MDVLVIDIGGGTSDLSLFELRLNEQSSMRDIKRVLDPDNRMNPGKVLRLTD